MPTRSRNHHAVFKRFPLAALAWLMVTGWAHAETVAPPAASYPVAHEAPLKATEEVVKEGEDFLQFRVEFNGIEGDRVPAYLYLPKKAQGKRPAMLLQYGSGCNKGSALIVNFGRQFVSQGFVVLTIDSPLRGERAPRGMTKYESMTSQFGYPMFLHYCGDYSRAVDYLLSRPEVDPDRISYVGVSWGAVTGLTFVANDLRVRAMVSLVGGAGFLGGLMGASDDHLREEAEEIDPVNHVGRIAPRPLLLLNAKQDRLMPRQSVETLERAAGKSAEVVWVDTDHDFRGPDHQKVGEIVLHFLEVHLPAK